MSEGEDGVAGPRAIAYCDADALRAGAARAYGAGYADIDPQVLAERVAAENGWQLVAVRIYAPDAQIVPDAEDNTRGEWAQKAKATSARVITQSGSASVRITLDATEALQSQAVDVVMLLGGGDALIPLAEKVRATARGQDRDLRCVSVYVPSAGPYGRPTPAADEQIGIDRQTAERSLFLKSGPRMERRIIVDRPVPPPAPVHESRIRERPVTAAYGMGFAASLLVLIWEDVVAAGVADALAWSEWRWAVSVTLAAAKSLVWPLYWLARLFGIDAGG